MKGYRAPSFSIGRKALWAFEEIAKAGYRYGSSVYPVRHDLYGMNRNLPAGGGGHLPSPTPSRGRSSGE